MHRHGVQAHATERSKQHEAGHQRERNSIGDLHRKEVADGGDDHHRGKQKETNEVESHAVRLSPGLRQIG
jgi:hypothetical protein